MLLLCMHIKELRAEVIRNSRGEKTIQVVVNKKYKASAASGASRGKHEVAPFPEKGLAFAVAFLNKHPHFRNFSLEEFSDLALFDSFIPFLGGNTVVALQSACLQALSEGEPAPFLSSRLKFPIPLGNCGGGGAHSKGFGTDVQEFLLLPQAKSFAERVALNRSVYDMIGKLSRAKRKTDEGAFILGKSTEEVFAFLSQLLEKYREIGFSVAFGIDMAASQFFRAGKYHYRNFSASYKRKIFSRKAQISYVNDLIQDYHLAYVEDPLEEEDFSGFAQISHKALVCGDDLITTDIERLKIALKHRSVTSIIVKPNQIGSLVKTKEIVDYCRNKGIVTVISHRSGETMDSMIADLAAAWHIPYIKTGIFGKEREVKLQRLISLEEKH